MSGADGASVMSGGPGLDCRDSVDDGFAGEGVVQRQDLDGAQVDVEVVDPPVQLAFSPQPYELAARAVLKKVLSPLTRTLPTPDTLRVNHSSE